MADWVTISSLATAGGTLVLAVATFSSVRSANRSARLAERSLMAGLRPVLIPSREEDPPERVRFGDQQVLTVPGHGAAVVVARDVIYLAIGLRNGGSGLAVLHGWRVSLRPAATPRGETGRPREESVPPLEEFRRQQIDLYIPAGDTGYWLGALRDPAEPIFQEIQRVRMGETAVTVDLLYGDHEGGQRTIVRFIIADWPEVDGERTTTLRYWNVDRDDPR
jgi:hypothetical protein